MFSVSFFVTGTPRPAGSKRGFRHPHSDRILIVDASGSAGKVWRRQIQVEAKRVMQTAPPLPYPVKLRCTFMFKRPQSHYNKSGLKPAAKLHHTQKPDATKLLRALEDALTGIVWLDDAQVVEQHVTKHWSDTTSGVHVTVTAVASDGDLEHE